MTKRRAPLKRRKPLFSRHKHSGKRLPHHHTGYLPLLFFLLFTGFLLAGISRTATANPNIVVVGRIPAPLPPSGAFISLPLGGEVFDAIPIDVQGTCPAGYLVKIYRNGSFSGSVLCSLTGTFDLQSDLFVGANELTAHVYNITDDEGPLTPAVDVTYSPPTPPVITPQGTGTTPQPTEKEIIPQFILKTESTYKGYVVGQKIEWELEAIGGSAPYAFNIDWGDGETTVVSRKEAGKFTVSHTYKEPGGYKGSYTIIIKGSDHVSQSVFVQIFVIVNVPFVITSSNGTAVQTRPPLSFNNFDAKTVALVTYFLLLAVIASFWLGEEWKIRHLPKRLMAPKHRLHRI